MKPGRSHHLIGLVRGQFGDIPEAEWLDFLAAAGFDGWEEASWELDLAACDTPSGAEACAAGRLAAGGGLAILSVAAHLQGQALGDEPSAKTLPFVGGEAVEAYVAWRKGGHEPPRTDPYHVPDEVSLDLLLERFAPVFDACREADTTFDLECHRGERAMGDLESAGDYVRFLEDAGYGSDVVGFNLDPSHMVWQGVSPIDFIREYAPWIHAAHIKGVHVVPLVIEWEDNDAEKRAGAVAALAAVRAADLPPATGRHDDALHATRRKAPAAAS